MNPRFIGCGGAFDFAYGNSAVLFQFRGVGLLVDCGHTVFPALGVKGLLPQVEYLFLTHTHDDHCGSLGSLVYFQYYAFGRRLKILVASEEHEHEIRALLRLVVRDVDRFAELISIDDIPGLHAISTKGLHFRDMPTWALYLDDGAERVLYSGDLGHPTVLRDWLHREQHKPSLIFHEASWLPVPGVHCLYSDLYHYAEIAPTYLYHCAPDRKPIECSLPHVIEVPSFIA
jgi:glyoxylase-like metal-dependent hydrolase (beta-lactamase superfamily II)